MTLLVNEIHVLSDLRQCPILFAADRRITFPGKTPPKFMKKIFQVEHLNAGVGYYGLAQVNEREYLSSWLPNFIRHSIDVSSLRDFAIKLHDELNQKVRKAWLCKQVSGLHICGYNADGLPELWHISNHQMRGNTYVDIVPQYRLSEDFLREHARARGFDGTNPVVPNSFIQYYINGDVRPFHSSWIRLNEFIAEMFSYPDFKSSAQPKQYLEVAKWKMEVIASFYRKFAKKPLIGKPIDAFSLFPRRVG